MTQSSRAVPETGVVDSGVASASVRPEPSSVDAAALLDTEVEREAERIADSMVRRAPNFLEKITGDFYEMLLTEVQAYLRDNAAFNIKSELSALRASLQAERTARTTAERERDKLQDAVNALEQERDGFANLAALYTRERDEAMAALREKEERVKALEACVDGGLKAVNAAYQQANAEQLGQDRTADRLDKIVMEWRTQARSVLSSVQPVSGSREQRGNEEGSDA